MKPTVSRLLLLAGCGYVVCAKGKGKNKAYSGGSTYDAHHELMALLKSTARGCDASNGTLVASANASYVPPSFCETKLPKRRQCVALSFSAGFEFGNAMAKLGCKTLSFDAFGGTARSLGPDYSFVPVDIGVRSGLSIERNITIATLSLEGIMESQDLTRIDLIRMSVSSMRQWKVLKNLAINGWLKSVFQLSLDMHFSDPTMWSDYLEILEAVTSEGHKPFYVSKQPGATYLQVQEGSFSLYDQYEISFGNVKS